MKTRFGCVALLWLATGTSLAAQTTGVVSPAPGADIPRLLRFNGTLSSTPIGLGGRSLDTIAAANVLSDQMEIGQSRANKFVTLTFSLYAQASGGAALWQETQDVQIDTSGHYTVLLGSAQGEGLPIALFSSGNAEWLGVRQQGQFEQQRIMLLSVPYALKAGDIETFGGKPPSAYALASGSVVDTYAPEDGSDQRSGGAVPAPGISGSGTTNYLPLWTNGSTLSSAVIYQSPAGFIGIGTTMPVAQLTVGGLAGTTTMPNGIAVSGEGPFTGVLGSSNSPAGPAAFGNASATSGNNVGVSGSTASDGGAGVTGFETATSGVTLGVEGLSSSPTGVGGNFTNLATTCTSHIPICVGLGGTTTSTTGGIAILGAGIHLSVTVPLGNVAFGVMGTTNQDGGLGVVGTTDDAIAMRGLTNSTDAAVATGYFDNVQNRSQIAPVVVARSREFDAECVIDVSGDLTCTGTISAVVPVDDGSRNLALYAEESPENWFEDAGFGRLAHGAATVALEPIFAQTVNSGVEYHVFLTPTGDCNGLYISNKTSSGFEVHELGAGVSNVGFDYRIVVRRRGFEEVRLADKTEEFGAHVATRVKRTFSPGSSR